MTRRSSASHSACPAASRAPDHLGHIGVHRIAELLARARRRPRTLGRRRRWSAARRLRAAVCRCRRRGPAPTLAGRAPPHPVRPVARPGRPGQGVRRTTGAANATDPPTWSAMTSPAPTPIRSQSLRPLPASGSRAVLTARPGRTARRSASRRPGPRPVGRPRGHQPVTREGDHLAPMFGDQRRELGEVGVEESRQLFGTGGAALRQPFRQRREPGDVGEKDGGGEALHPRSIERFSAAPRNETGETPGRRPGGSLTTEPPHPLRPPDRRCGPRPSQVCHRLHVVA